MTKKWLLSLFLFYFYNQYSPLVTVAPLSSTVGKVYPFEVYIAQGTAGLNNNSKIMVIHLRSIDKKRILNKIGAIKDNKILNKLNEIISEHFDL
ncbi:type II toxin-antitoxin system PemK/MazF family toxin [Candidatus Aerophobetes bacterium]|nr:type II toxin-antitoxin system PemK/MazF family toxin [Candidatus Aerophobetes bacterium]